MAADIPSFAAQSLPNDPITMSKTEPELINTNKRKDREAKEQEHVEVEERLLTYKVETHFCIVVFDRVPVWLLSLDWSFAASVVIWGVPSARALSDRLDGSTSPPPYYWQPSPVWGHDVSNIQPL
jgi:hypothetical protein